MVAGRLADGLVAFACSQPVSTPAVSWLHVLLLMVLSHFPALSM